MGFMDKVKAQAEQAVVEGAAGRRPGPGQVRELPGQPQRRRRCCVSWAGPTTRTSGRAASADVLDAALRPSTSSSRPTVRSTPPRARRHRASRQPAGRGAGMPPYPRTAGPALRASPYAAAPPTPDALAQPAAEPPPRSTDSRRTTSSRIAEDRTDAPRTRWPWQPLRATASIMRDPKLPVVLRRVLDLGVDMTGAAGGAIAILDAAGHIDHVISRTPVGRHHDDSRVDRHRLGSDWTGVGDVLDADIAVHGAVFGHPSAGCSLRSDSSTPVSAIWSAALVTTAGAAIESAAIHEESELRRRWLDASNDVMRELIDVGDEQPLGLIVRHTAFCSARTCAVSRCDSTTTTS